MSRHNLTPRRPDLVSSIAVGWDHELGSFYAHIYEIIDQHPGEAWVPSHEIGDDFFAVTSPAAVVAFISQYADIPNDLQDTLNADAIRERNCEPPALIGISHSSTHPAYALSAAEIPF